MLTHSYGRWCGQRARAGVGVITPGSVPNPILPGDKLMAEIPSFFIYKTAQIVVLSHKIGME